MFHEWWKLEDLNPACADGDYFIASPEIFRKNTNPWGTVDAATFLAVNSSDPTKSWCGPGGCFPLFKPTQFVTFDLYYTFTPPQTGDYRIYFDIYKVTDANCRAGTLASCERLARLEPNNPPGYARLYSDVKITELAPAAPVLKSPANNSVGAPEILEWFASAGATRYRVFASRSATALANLKNTDNSCGPACLIDGATTPNTTYTVPNGLLAPGDDVYWMVRAEANTVNSKHSEIWRFTVDVPAGCPVLQVTSPAGAVNIMAGDRVPIAWTGSDPNNKPVRVRVGYDLDTLPNSGNETVLATNLPATGNYTWDTTGLTDGRYFVFATIDNGQCTPTTRFAPGVVIVGSVCDPNDPPPTIEHVDVWQSGSGLVVFKVLATAYVGEPTVKVVFNGQSRTLTPKGGSLYVTSMSYAKPGKYTYTVIVTDGCGKTDQFGPATLKATWGNELGFGTLQNGDCGGGSQGAAAKPINTYNGNFVHRFDDATVHGLGDIVISRVYNSHASAWPTASWNRYTNDGATETWLDGPPQLFGPGWSFDYNMHVLEVSEAPFFEGAQVIYPDGRAVTFKLVNGSYIAEAPDVHDVLKKDGGGWVLQENCCKRATKLFDAGGFLTEIRDRNGNTVKLIYANGRPVRIENSSGRAVQFGYDGGGHITSAALPDGVSLVYEYQAGRLTGYVNGRMLRTRYDYSPDGFLSAVVTPKGHPSLRMTYNAATFQTLSQIVGETERYEFAYVDNGVQITTVTDAYGHARVDRYDADHRLVRSDYADSTHEEWRYDAAFNRTSHRTRAGEFWAWTYDPNGNRLTADGPLGWFKQWTYNPLNLPTAVAERVDGQNLRITRFEYDANGNLVRTCNALGDCASITYDGRGLPVEEVDYAQSHTWKEYDAAGDLTAVTDPDGFTTRYTYDGFGRVQTEHRPASGPFAYDRDGNGNVIGISGPLNFHRSFVFDDNDNLELEVDPNNGTIRREYDRSDRLTKVWNQLVELVAQIEYGAMGERKSVTDGEGRVTTFDHDSLLRPIHRREPMLTDTWFELDAEGRIVNETDARRIVTHVDYDELGRIERTVRNYRPNAGLGDDLNVTHTFSYNLVDHLLSEDDAEGNRTRYVNDLLGRQRERTDAEQNHTADRFDAVGDPIVHTNARGFDTLMSYTAGHRLKTVRDAKGGVTTYTYDGDGRVTDVVDANGITTHSEFDALGRRTRLVQNYRPNEPRDSETNVRTEFTWDPAGNLRHIRNARGDVTEHRYDAAHRRVETIDFAGAHLWFGYDRVGNLRTVTDDNRHTTEYVYDDLNRRIATINPEGHRASERYDKTGNVIGRTDPNGNDTTFTVDALGRPVVKVDALGGHWLMKYNREGRATRREDANGHATALTYDRIYRPRTVVLPEGNSQGFTWDPNGNLIAGMDAENNPTRYDFDQLDRLIEITNAENEKTTIGYDPVGNETSRTQPDNTVTAYVYDPLYRLSAVIENYAQGQPATNDRNVRTSYTHDAVGNLTGILNAINALTTFQHDGMGRVVRETNQLNVSWTYTFDGAGNRITRRDANNALTRYAYYPDNEIASVAYQDGTMVQYDYDKNNNRTLMQDRWGATRWVYDVLDRVTYTSDPLRRSLRIAYDAVGNRTLLVYPDGGRQTYQYSDNDWLQKVSPPGNQVTTYARDLVGNVSRIENSNRTVTEITRDRVYRVRGLVNRQVGGGNHVTSGFDYTYNLVGDATNVVKRYGWRNPPVEVESYGYDGLHRLVRAEIAPQGNPNDKVEMSYAYDAVGNRLLWNANDDLATQTPRDGFTKTYTYDAASLMQAVVTQPADKNGRAVALAFDYDRNGNRIGELLSDGNGPIRGTDHAYDGENRLVYSQDYDLVGQNTENRIDRAYTALDYDGDGRRIASTYDPKLPGPGGAKRVEYAFDALDPIAEYEMLSGQHTNLHRGANRQLVSMTHFKAGTQGQMYWYAFDRKGDVVGLTKQNGQSHHNYRYDPYGAILPENGNFDDPHNHYTLTGKEFDEHTGLVWFGARHYDPQVGVWLTQDLYRGRIHDPTSLHRTMYVANNPVNNRDLYGYAAVQIQGNGLYCPANGGVSNMTDRTLWFVPNVPMCVGKPALYGTPALDAFEPRQTPSNANSCRAEPPVLQFDAASHLRSPPSPSFTVANGLQRNAEVYVWNPHVDGYGHAAMKLSDGTDISWWPAGAGSEKDQYWSGRPGGAHSYADDIGSGGEGQAPDSTYDLGSNCLDEEAIKTWWKANYRNNPNAKWAVLRNSCSDIARQALNQGSSVFNPCSLSHSNLVWTPKDVGAYADCLSRWCASKKAGALNATGRYLWEISGGWAVNTLKSLGWKAEIVAHSLRAEHRP